MSTVNIQKIFTQTTTNNYFNFISFYLSSKNDIDFNDLLNFEETPWKFENINFQYEENYFDTSFYHDPRLLLNINQLTQTLDSKVNLIINNFQQYLTIVSNELTFLNKDYDIKKSFKTEEQKTFIIKQDTKQVSVRTSTIKRRKKPLVIYEKKPASLLSESSYFGYNSKIDFLKKILNEYNSCYGVGINQVDRREILNVNEHIFDNIYDLILKNKPIIFKYYLLTLLATDDNNKNMYFNIYTEYCFFYTVDRIIKSQLFKKYLENNIVKILNTAELKPNHVVIGLNIENDKTVIYALNLDCNIFYSYFYNFITIYLNSFFVDFVERQSFLLRKLIYIIYTFIFIIIGRIMNNDIAPKNHYNLVWRLGDITKDTVLLDKDKFKIEISGFLKKNLEEDIDKNKSGDSNFIKVSRADLELRSSFVKDIKGNIINKRDYTVGFCEYLQQYTGFKESGILGVSMFGYTNNLDNKEGLIDSKYNSKTFASIENITNALKLFRTGKKTETLYIFPCLNSLSDTRLASNYPNPIIYNNTLTKIKNIQFSKEHNLLSTCYPFENPQFTTGRAEDENKLEESRTRKQDESSYTEGAKITIPGPNENVVYREYFGSLMFGSPNYMEANFIGNGNIPAIVVEITPLNRKDKIIYDILNFFSLSKIMPLFYPEIYKDNKNIEYEQYIEYILNFNYQKIMNKFKSNLTLHK